MDLWRLFPQHFVTYRNDEVTSQIILSGVGALNESDIMLAVSSGAIVIGFNVRADVPAKKIGKTK